MNKKQPFIGPVTLQDHVQRQLADLRTLLDERYATQTKALDAAFVAQQAAMRIALESAEKAVATAMVAAEKATAKAELAAEKRFEAVNEFRGQLNDQAQTFMPRSEADIRISGISNKLDEDRTRMVERVSALELRMASRLDITAGQKSGSNDTNKMVITVAAVLVSTVIMVIGIISLVLGLK